MMMNGVEKRLKIKSSSYS